MEDESKPYLEVASDPSVLRRIVLVYAILATVIGPLPLTLMLIIEKEPVGLSSAAQVGGVFVVFMLVFSVLCCAVPWWWLKAGRTRYQVDGSKLRFFDGELLLDEFDCSDVFLIRGAGFISWRECLTAGFGVKNFPRITVRTSEMHTGPPILLWGEKSASAFDLLRRAIVGQVEGHHRVVVDLPDPPDRDS